MNSPRQAVILCGGLGTRLRPITDTLPKPMVPVREDKPFLYFLLEQLAEQGVRRFVLLTGYLGEVITSYFGDGTQWGWQISYSHGPADWETGRRVWEAREMLDTCFLLLYADNFAAFSLDKAWALHRGSHAAITMMIKEKLGGNVAWDANGQVAAYSSSRNGDGLNYVELGYMLVQRAAVLNAYNDIADAPDISFSRILELLAKQNAIYAYLLQTPYYSISDPVRLVRMRHHLSHQKILLIDRDGTLHERAPKGEYVLQWPDVRLLPSALKALRRLSRAGFRFAVISNQAAVGRGLATKDVVERLNEQLRELLLSEGIEILKFYVCPHHWEDTCTCRKPSPGLFYQCATDYDLRLDRTLYVGDDPRDIAAAEAAGSKCIYVGTAQELSATRFADHKIYANFDAAVEDIVAAYSR